jgi:hypothetical protein
MLTYKVFLGQIKSPNYFKTNKDSTRLKQCVFIAFEVNTIKNVTVRFITEADFYKYESEIKSDVLNIPYVKRINNPTLPKKHKISI